MDSRRYMKWEFRFGGEVEDVVYASTPTLFHCYVR